MLAVSSLDALHLYDSNFRLISKLSVSIDNTPFGLAFSPDNTKLAVGYLNSQNIDLFSTKDLHHLRSVGITDSITPMNDIRKKTQELINFKCVNWSSDGKILFIAGNRKIGTSTNGNEAGAVIFRKLFVNKQNKYLDIESISSEQIEAFKVLRNGEIIYGTSRGKFAFSDKNNRHHFMSKSKTIDNEKNRRFGLTSDGNTITFFMNDEAKSKVDHRMNFSMQSWKLSDSLNKLSANSTIFNKNSLINNKLPKLLGDFGVENKRILYIHSEYYTNWRVRFSSDVLGINASLNGKYIVAALQDGSFRWVRVRDGKIVVSITFIVGEESWIMWTQDGFFALSSPKVAQYLQMSIAKKTYSINQFYDVFYRPDIVRAALAGEDTSSMVTLTIEEAIKNPPPIIQQAKAPASSSAEKIRVDYRIKSEGGGIGEVRVFHNGKLVKSDGFIRKLPLGLLGKKTGEMTSDILVSSMRSISIKAKKGEVSQSITSSRPKPDLYESFVEVEPIPGENEIAIIAFNAQNSVQSLTKTVTFKSNKAPVAPMLYILAVGIDEYKDTASNLKYAVKDSKDMSAKLLSKTASIYGTDNIFVEKISNAQASRVGIMNAINKISAKITPTDHFILFVASHGVLLGEQYYMVTNDYDGALDLSMLISSNEIVDLSKKIKALSQLYILDTCHAGGMDGVVSGLYDARMSVLAKKMGLHIFASSNSVEEALDGYKGNGLFTHTLLDGLNNNTYADKNSDRIISVKELGNFSKAKTKNIAEGLGHRQEPIIINFGQDNPVYKLQ